ncbi:MAG: GNAT family N-acetyltransferase [Bacillota bacterium]
MARYLKELVFQKRKVIKLVQYQKNQSQKIKKKLKNLKIEIETNTDNLADAFALRKEVFVEGQGVPADLEIDDKEEQAVHFLARKNDKLVATCRLRILDDYAKLERMAVKSTYRGQGIGSSLCTRVEEFATKRGLDRIKLHAQVRAKDFYQSNGYSLLSEEEFIEAGIKHLKMDKKL